MHIDVVASNYANIRYSIDWLKVVSVVCLIVCKTYSKKISLPDKTTNNVLRHNNNYMYIRVYVNLLLKIVVRVNSGYENTTMQLPTCFFLSFRHKPKH